MKKLVLILAVLCLLLSLCACGETAQPVETEAPTETAAPVETEPVVTEHVHSYVDTVIGPFCVAGGYTKHQCECGDMFVDTKTDAVGHDWQTFDVAPTDCTQGYTDFTCNVCGVHCTDNYIPANWWDTEEAMTALSEELAAYAESIGVTITDGEPSEDAAMIPVEQEGNSHDVILAACQEALEGFVDAGSVTVQITEHERYGHLISIG